MADNDDFDENEFEDETGPKALRAALKKVQKQVETLQEENNSLKSQGRVRSVGEFFTSKNLSPKLAALVPAEVGEDEASLTAWLGEYAEVFGAPVTTTDESNESEEDAATRQAHERVANATSGADTQGRSADIMAKITNAESPEALTALLQNSGQ